MLRIVLFGLALSVVAAGPAAAQDADASGAIPILSVIGRGSHVVHPDYTSISASVSADAPTLGEAQANVAARMAKADAAADALKRRGLKVEAKTYQVFQFSDPPPGISSASSRLLWKARANYSLRLNALENVSDVATALVDAGFELRSMRFLSNQPEVCRDEARKAAARDAIAQARTYSEALGVGLGEIRRIGDGAVNDSSPGAGPGAFALDGSRAAAPPTRIDVPDTITCEGTVKVVWRIAPKP